MDDDPGACSVPRGGNWRPGARWAQEAGRTREQVEAEVATMPAHRQPPMRELGRRSEAAEHPFRHVTAVPNDVPLPPVTLLGSSDYSARLAGTLGLGFAFAYHFSPHALLPALHAYRANFTPGTLAKPHAIVTVSVFCAPTDDEADFLAGPMRLTFLKLRSGQPVQLPTPEEARDYPYTLEEQAALGAIRAMQIVGSPETVRRELGALLAKTQADELMLTTMMHAHDDRLRSFTLVAEALRGVGAVGAVAA